MDSKNDFKDMSNDELESEIDKKRIRIDELRALMSIESEGIISIQREIQSRDEWYAEKVINNMLMQLEEYKNEISLYSYNLLVSKLNIINERKRSYDRRSYKRGNIIENLYFDLSSPIMIRAKQNNMIELMLTHSSFYIKFEFNRTSRKINRKSNGNIFTTGKNRAANFICQNKELVYLNSKILSFVKNSYSDYNDIVPDLINVVKFIENDLDSIFIAYNLAINSGSE